MFKCSTLRSLSSFFSTVGRFFCLSVRRSGLQKRDIIIARLISWTFWRKLELGWRGQLLCKDFGSEVRKLKSTLVLIYPELLEGHRRKEKESKNLKERRLKKKQRWDFGTFKFLFSLQLTVERFQLPLNIPYCSYMASFKSPWMPLERDASKRRRERDSDSSEGDEESRPNLNLSLSGLGLETQSCLGGYNTTANDDYEDEDVSYDDLDPNATRRIICDLIDTCQDLDGFQETEDGLLAEQVKQSKLIFEKQFGLMERVPSKGVSPKAVLPKVVLLKGPKLEPVSADSTPVVSPAKVAKDNPRHSYVLVSQDKENQIVGDASASSMYLSFKHTQICAALLRKKVQAMGVSEAVFSTERYLQALKKQGTDSLGEYSSRRALENVTISTACTIKTFPNFPCMLGSFDHREFIKKLENKDDEVNATVAPAKPKRGKLFEKGSKAAEHEEINASQADTVANKKNAGEESSAELRRCLIKVCNEKDGPVNLLEFTLNKDSIRDTLNNTFGVAFGVRDGSIELAHSGGKSDRNKLNLSVAPCKPNKSVDDGSTNVNRRQCIMSVSAKTLRQLHNLAEGEPVIKPSS